MKIKKITPSFMKEAVVVLQRGGVVVYPTDTLYGLGADISNKKAIEKVYKIKGRKFNKPLLILVSSKKQINKFAYLNKTAEKVINKFLPGPLTLILKKKKIVSVKITGRKKTVGVRLPKNKTAINLAKKLGRPITTTSANIAGAKTPMSGQAIYNHFKKQKYQPDLILDAGELNGKPSTILNFSEKRVKIIREGEGIKEIKNFLKT